MPGYKAHLAAGAVLGGLGLAAAVHWGYMGVEPLPLAALLGFFLLGALFPDVDTNSVGQHVFYSILLAVDVTLIFQRRFEWAAWLGFFALLPGVSKHRGWTHTWWAMLLVPLPFLILPALATDSPWRTFFPLYLAFAGGYFSHLLLDRKFR